MAIVWQMAGRFVDGRLDEARAEFLKLKPLFDSTKGFLRAQILANENGRQIQFLTWWANYDDSVAFFKAQGTELMTPMSPYLEEMGTVVCSAVLFDYGPRPGQSAEVAGTEADRLAA
ncbi:MAG: hypothetical protein U1F52_01330 [Burkholderiales bacterium]